MAKKRSFRGKPKKGGQQKMTQGNIMAQFQKMQADMEVAQADMENKEFSVTTGGGALEVIVTGHQRIKAIKIDPEMLDPEEVDIFQDLLVATINQAIEKSQEEAAKRMEGVTGNTGMGDLLGGMGLG